MYVTVERFRFGEGIRRLPKEKDACSNFARVLPPSSEHIPSQILRTGWPLDRFRRLQAAAGDKSLRRSAALAGAALGPFRLIPRAARRSGVPHDSGARGTLARLATLPPPVPRRRPAWPAERARRRISKPRLSPPLGPRRAGTSHWPPPRLLRSPGCLEALAPWPAQTRRERCSLCDNRRPALHLPSRSAHPCFRGPP